MKERSITRDKNNFAEADKIKRELNEILDLIPDEDKFKLEDDDSTKKNDINEIKTREIPQDIIQNLKNNDNYSDLLFGYDYERIDLRNAYEDVNKQITVQCFILVYVFIEENLKEIIDDCALWEAGYKNDYPLYIHENNKLLKRKQDIQRRVMHRSKPFGDC